MLLSSQHIHWLRAKKGSLFSSSQCRGVENQEDAGRRGGGSEVLGAWLRSQVIKYPCWGGALNTSKLPAASSQFQNHTSRSLSLLPVFPLPPLHSPLPYTLSVYNLWRLTQAGLQTLTNRHTTAQPQNKTSAKIFAPSHCGLPLSALQPLSAKLSRQHWLYNSAK